MAKFITSNELNSEIEKLFNSAKQRIVIISPYIKLHERYHSVLKTHKENPNVSLVIVFGKNDDDPSRSMKENDLEFFKDFPNVEIRYAKSLHAKFYSNETTSVLSSMNLYDYSQNNNIEAGVLSTIGMLGADSFDKDARDYFDRVISQAELIYQKKPKYESAMLGFSKKYVGSEVTHDTLASKFSANSQPKTTSKENFALPEKKGTQGYCIRTGVPVPFNPQKPFSDKSHENWLRFRNENYPEKFCHFSGEPTNGETCFARPILQKNWKEAQKIMGK